MNTKRNQTLISFYNMMHDLELLDNLKKTLEWDMRVVMPKKGTSIRSEQLRYIASQEYSILVSSEMENAIATLSECNELSLLEARMLEVAKHEHAKLKKIPQRMYTDYAALNVKSEMIWQQARQDNNFSMFKDYLIKQFEYKKAFGSLNGFPDDPMSGLMTEYEAGLDTKQMDRIFDDIKAFAVPFLHEVREKHMENAHKRLDGLFPKRQQYALNMEMIQKIGYDLEAGRLDESAHPYNSSCNRYDVRITTRYFEHDFTISVLSTLHEMGHAIYWQNMGEELIGTNLTHAASFGFDESQSRIMENMIGRSEAFWRYFLPEAKKYFPGLNCSVQEMFRNLNKVGMSCIRLEADELSYNLHIILRYELEKALFSGDLNFNDLPEAWNDKSTELLGVRPQSNTEGLLQDMHWASGHIGYFQTYVVANCYDGHLLHLIHCDQPDIDERISKGDFVPLVRWLNYKVHQFGALYTPRQLLKNISGESLSAKYYIEYLKNKFTSLYNIDI